MRPRRRSEAGQAGVLVVGFFLVAVLLVVVVVDASAAYLRRQRLDALADGASLAATEGVDTAQLYVGGVGDSVEIDPVAARARVAAYLRDVGAFTDHPGLTYRVRTTGDTVEVVVRTPLELPFAPPGWDGSTTVTGTAASYVAVGD